MDIVQCNNLVELKQHIKKVSDITESLKYVAWKSFEYECEGGKSVYVSNLLAEIGTQCDVITRALGIITGAGDLLQEELDKIEEKAKGE